MNMSGAVTLKRIPPQGPVQAYRTYSAVSPPRTHWRKATCQESDCEQYQYGWVTTLDLGTELGQQLARDIAADTTRKWSVQDVGGGLVKFVFPPGQQCFRPHKVRIERPPVFVVRNGDWRGNPDGYRRIHTAAEFWVEDQQETLDRVRTLVQRG